MPAETQPPTTVTMDLSVGDVHTPSATSAVPAFGYSQQDGAPRTTERDMSISAQQRAKIPERDFALPKARKYPLDTAAHTRNAAARLEQMKKRGKVTDAEYHEARARIAKAAKKFGIESEYNESDRTSARSFHVRADIAHGGELHVKHMTDRAFYDGEGIQLSEQSASDDGTPVWNQIAKRGAFAGHPAGPFQLTAQTFDEIVDNFRATTNRAIPIDYEHASEQDPTSGSIPTSGAPAQGWIRELKIQNGDLWGLVEWLPQARDQIRAGNYKFLSPAIRFNSKDRVTGKPIGARLTSAALTNEPFLDGMAPLAAKDAPPAPRTGLAFAATLSDPGDLDRPVHDSHEYMPKIRAALGMHDMASAAECADQLDRLRDMCMSAGPEGVHEGIQLAPYTQRLSEFVGASPGMTWAQVFDCVEDLIHAAIDEHVIVDHGGSPASMSDRTATARRRGEESTVTINEESATTVALKDAQNKLGEMSVALKDASDKRAAAEAKLAQVELSNKDLAAKVATFEKASADAAAELKTLRDEKSAREQADLMADVETAYATYKDKKSLSETDKVAMVRFAKADREAFNMAYPPVPLEQRHLLRQATPAEPRRGDDGAMSFTTLTRKIMSEDKLSFADAQIEASRRIGRVR